ncbi:MAG: ATP-binding protein [Algoriphagus sp.]|uniref:sensor histidine kinase n=1 Tax=Algoriphagus sp. TaxID=1872435 RepID=UPI002733ED8F|nr:ATP-binding protein [Algoriphagus sp.]MDP3470270.1 ATP-binding protein [Algoriphagus sp.]
MTILITGFIFIVDLNTNSTVAVAGIYTVVILYSWLLPGKYTSLYTAILCTVLMVIAAIQNDEMADKTDNLSGMNMGISLVVIWTSVTLVFIAKNSFSALENINQQLSEKSAELLEKVMELDIQQEELFANKRNLEILNEDLVVKNRELERFTSIASHDLQEPLRTIGNMTQLISTRYYANIDDQGKKILDYVTAATNRMTMLIKGLLDFSRIGVKRVIQNVDCQNVVQTLIIDLDTLLKTSQSKVIFNELPIVMGNPIELRILFQNLISNAIKFKKKDVPAIIELTAKDQIKHVEFCIKDNGIGIDQSNFEKIFLIFQRLHKIEQYEGIGLGLAYCRKVVELHGGKIWVNSTIGVGTSFYFTLKKSL